MAYIVFTRTLDKKGRVMAVTECNYNDLDPMTHDEKIEFLVKCVEVLAKEIQLQSYGG